MATRRLTEQNFQEVLGGSDMILIDFWASWCGPCRFFAPVYERVSDKHPDIVFGKVDTEAERALAGAFQITSIPTLMIIRENVVLYARPGALPEPALEELITQARDVDLDEVRKQVRKQARTSVPERRRSA
jgi:thioredoxin 1